MKTATRPRRPADRVLMADAPLLTREEEADLAVRAKAGDVDARNQLITANMPFLVATASKYARRGLEVGDLVNEGALALIHSLRFFDPARGRRFLSYAGRAVRQHMADASVRDRTVMGPRNFAAMAGSWRAKERELSQALGRDATPEEVGAALGLSEKQAKTRRAAMATLKPFVSLGCRRSTELSAV